MEAAQQSKALNAMGVPAEGSMRAMGAREALMMEQAIQKVIARDTEREKQEAEEAAKLKAIVINKADVEALQRVRDGMGWESRAGTKGRDTEREREIGVCGLRAEKEEVDHSPLSLPCCSFMLIPARRTLTFLQQWQRSS